MPASPVVGRIALAVRRSHSAAAAHVQLSNRSSVGSSLAGRVSRQVSRRVLLIVGLTVVIVLVVCAFSVLLVLQGTLDLSMGSKFPTICYNLT